MMRRSGDTTPAIWTVPHGCGKMELASCWRVHTPTDRAYAGAWWTGPGSARVRYGAAGRDGLAPVARGCETVTERKAEGATQ